MRDLLTLEKQYLFQVQRAPPLGLILPLGGSARRGIKVRCWLYHSSMLCWFAPCGYVHLRDVPSASKSCPQSCPQSLGSCAQTNVAACGMRAGFLICLVRLGICHHADGEGNYTDGDKPKRRGPKPDSKPALTRRQELNRQAQRYLIFLFRISSLAIPSSASQASSSTPRRNRSDMPVSTANIRNPLSATSGRIEKGKSDTSKPSKRRLLGMSSPTPAEIRYRETLHLFRLREAFTIITREKTAVVDENRRLKAILDAHGIPYAFPSVSGMGQQQRQDSFNQSPEVTRFGSTYDQIGIDFVLA